MIIPFSHPRLVEHGISVMTPLSRSPDDRSSGRYCSIERKFRCLDDEEISADVLDTFVELGLGKLQGWDELLACPRLVVLAAGGSGKSEELSALEHRLRSGARDAFYMPLETLPGKKLSEALDLVDDLDAFEAWRSSDRIGWFLLDARDELMLNRHKLIDALRVLARGVRDHLHRVRVIVASRPADWRSEEDRAELLEILPVKHSLDAHGSAYSPLTEPVVGSTVSVTSEATVEIGSLMPDDDRRASVTLVGMLPLSRRQMRALAVHWQVDDTEEFSMALGTANAWRLYNRPLALRGAVRVWNAKRRLGTATEQREQIVRHALEDARDGHSNPHGTSELTAAAARLALGLYLTRRRDVSTASAVPGDDALSASSMLPEMSPETRATLLRSSLFDVRGVDTVRFHERDVAEYLAAKALMGLIERGLDWRDAAEILFATRHGHDVVRPSLRATAAWLAADHPDICEELHRRDPNALLSFGDPGRLPLPLHRTLLENLASELAEGDLLHHGIEHSQIDRFAACDLAPTVNDLWNRFPSTRGVRYLLLELIETGAMVDCLDNVAGCLSAGADPQQALGAVRVFRACRARSDLLVKLPALVDMAVAWNANDLRALLRELFPWILTPSEFLTLWPGEEDTTIELEHDGHWVVSAYESVAADSAEGRSLREKTVACLLRSDRETDDGSGNVLADALLAHCAAGWPVVATVPESAYLRVCAVARRFARHNARTSRIEQALNAHLRAAPVAVRREAFIENVRFMWEICTFSELLLPQALSARWRPASLEATLDEPWLIELVRDCTTDLGIRGAALHAVLSLRENAADDQVSDVVDLEKMVHDTHPLRTILKARIRAMQDYLESCRKLQKPTADQLHWANWDEWKRQLETRSDGMLLGDEQATTLRNARNYVARGGSIADNTRIRLPTRERLTAYFGPILGAKLVTAFGEFWREHVPATVTDVRNRMPRYRLVIDALGADALRAELSESGRNVVLGENEARRAVVHAMAELPYDGELLDSLLNSAPGHVEQPLRTELGRQIGLAPEYDGHSILATVAKWPTLVLLVKNDLTGWLVALAGRHRQSRRPDSRRELERRLRALLEAASSCESTTVGEVLAKTALTQARRLGRDELALDWLRLLGNLDPYGFTAYLETSLVEEPTTPGSESWRQTVFAVLFDRGVTVRFFALAPSDLANLSSRLYRLACRVLPPDDVSGCGHPRDLRMGGDAGVARSKLFATVAACPGPEGYAALRALRTAEAISASPARLEDAMENRARADADDRVFLQKEVCCLFERSAFRPLDADSLHTRVLRAFELARKFYEIGDLSPRPELREQSLEAPVQRDIAARLALSEKNWCRVTIEDESADRKRVDIRLLARAGELRAAVEIKLHHQWTPAKLAERMENQLLGQYLVDPSCPVGLFVVVRTLDRRYKHPETGKPFAFDEIMDWLRVRARELERQHDRCISIDVVGIDLR